MNRNDFFKKFVDAVQFEEEVDDSILLNNLEEWDSLAAVTTLALFNKHLGLKLGASDIKACSTIGNIMDLGNEKYA